MTLGQRLALRVLDLTFAVATFALGYWVAQDALGANPTWATGFAVVTVLLPDITKDCGANR